MVQAESLPPQWQEGVALGLLLTRFAAGLVGLVALCGMLLAGFVPFIDREFALQAAGWAFVVYGILLGTHNLLIPSRAPKRGQGSPGGRIIFYLFYNPVAQRLWGFAILVVFGLVAAYILV